MKRKTALLLLLSMMCFLTACGRGGQETKSSDSVTTVNPPDSAGDEEFSKPENTQDFTEVSSQENALDSIEFSKEEKSQETIEGAESSNILIVYFSRYGNTEYPDDVDATTSASIVADGNGRYGTTEYIANMIAEEVGGSLHRIETVTPYTTDFDELRDVNHDEMDRGYLPELKESSLDISAYDTVFVGYPVWATCVPQAVLSFWNSMICLGRQ